MRRIAERIALVALIAAMSGCGLDPAEPRDDSTQALRGTVRSATTGSPLSGVAVLHDGRWWGTTNEHGEYAFGVYGELHGALTFAREGLITVQLVLPDDVPGWTEEGDRFELDLGMTSSPRRID
ncbi:MAG: hypothetical protein R3E97_19970 [Candidatus Eisenbacteria bacterium]